MGNTGRPSVPANIKKLRGTDRKDREKEIIVFTAITEVPKPAAWLYAKAKKNFVNICEMLIEKGLLTNANAGHVVIMAQEFARYEMAIRELKKKGEVLISKKNGYQQPSPWVAIANQCQKNYRDYAALFGLDPISATKVGGMKKSEKDPFDEMQKKYN
jgi:P27 family predicted phage terminase small subunit